MVITPSRNFFEDAIKTVATLLRTSQQLTKNSSCM